MADVIHARITKSVVEQLKPGQSVRDVELKGFGARRQKTSTSYFLQKKIAGRVRWFTIGPHGSPWTPATARKEAYRLLQSLASGEDPGLDAQARRDEITVKEATELFMADHGPKLKTHTKESYDRVIRLKIVPNLGKKRINDLQRSDISRLHVRLKDQPAMANYTLAVLSKLIGWAQEHGYRADDGNPIRGIKKYRETKRERYLSTEEFARLGEVLDELEHDEEESPFVLGALRLLLFTGARLNEILTLEWRWVDLERRLLLLPDSKTGTKTIALNDAAVAVLTALPSVQGNPYVIVGHRHGSHLVNLQKPWRRIRGLAKLDDVRLHDLRHTFASMAAASGASLPMIGKLLGHSQPQTTARYAHLAADPIQQLNQDVGALITRAMKKE